METYNRSEIVQNAPQPSEDEFTKTIEKYTASIPSSACRRSYGIFAFLPASGQRKVGQFHRAVGSDLADHRPLQQSCKTRGP